MWRVLCVESIVYSLTRDVKEIRFHTTSLINNNKVNNSSLYIYYFLSCCTKSIAYLIIKTVCQTFLFSLVQFIYLSTVRFQVRISSRFPGTQRWNNKIMKNRLQNVTKHRSTNSKRTPKMLVSTKLPFHKNSLWWHHRS